MIRTKIFLYHMANACWSSNLISSLKVNGIKMEDEKELKGGIATINLMFEHSQENRLDLAADLFKGIEALDKDLIEGLFLEDEVLFALSDLDGDKALGLDGFSLVFRNFCWAIVGRKVMQFFEEFYLKDFFVHNLNATFLLLFLRRECKRY